MPETIRCPDCGHVNASGSTSCSACNFPLAPESAPEPTQTAARAEEHAPATLPRRWPRHVARRPRPASNQALSLWLMFGFIAAVAVIYVAVKANLDRGSQPVEGSSQDQQKSADEFRALLDKDSSSVDAHIGLANLLYDTGNWSEAIIHYRAAIRRDSSHVHALVDLGVCYFNLSDPEPAEKLFMLALQRDPHQPVALFNLGIVHEHRKDYRGAMEYLHRALQSAPPEEMKTALVEAMKRVQEKLGTAPPPLPDGAR